MEKQKTNTWLKISAFLFILVLVFTYLAYQSNKDYKENCGGYLPKIDSQGNFYYDVDCDNIDTSKNWTAQGDYFLASIFGILSLVFFYIGRKKIKNGKG